MCRHELPTADIEYEAQKRARSRAQRTNNGQSNNAPRTNNNNNTAASDDPVARMFASYGINVRYDDEDDDEDEESNPSAISSMYS